MVGFCRNFFKITNLGKGQLPIGRQLYRHQQHGNLHMLKAHFFYQLNALDAARFIGQGLPKWLLENLDATGDVRWARQSRGRN